MAYCTSADLVNMIGTAQLTQLTNDTANSTTPDADVVTAMIARAQSFMDSQFSDTFLTPLVITNDPIIRDLCVSISIFNCFLRRFAIMEVPPNWKEAFDQACASVKKIAELDLSIDYTLNPIQTKMADISAPTKIVDFSNSDSQWSKF